MQLSRLSQQGEFYNHLILSGTKINVINTALALQFYNHLILSGTKISQNTYDIHLGFTIT